MPQAQYSVHPFCGDGIRRCPTRGVYPMGRRPGHHYVEYERFLALAPAELDSNTYYIQKEFSNHWPMFFSKLRKNNTACIERYLPKDPLTHQGIYIDIFPCDALSDAGIKRKMQFLASKIVIAQSLYRRGYLTEDLRKKLAMQISRCLPTKHIWEYVVNKKEPTTQMVHSFFGASSSYEKAIYPRTI